LQDCSGSLRSEEDLGIARSSTEEGAGGVCCIKDGRGGGEEPEAAESEESLK
jgi:hypothetical protein